VHAVLQVINERDILGTQLVRRNDELALLYEKIKIQQSTLNKGEVQYNQRIEDIRVLKLEIRKLRRERMLLQKSVANVDDLRSVNLVLEFKQCSCFISYQRWFPWQHVNSVFSV
jgi:uncharacterized protein Smg (DUF494 family)